jgi:hypothetical protein
LYWKSMATKEEEAVEMKQKMKKNKKKRYKTTVKGWIYDCENLATTVQSDRIKNCNIGCHEIPRCWKP